MELINLAIGKYLSKNLKSSIVSSVCQYRLFEVYRQILNRRNWPIGILNSCLL